MKKSSEILLRFFIIYIACFFCFCTKSKVQATTPPFIDTQAYKLVWSDEFDNPVINTNTWNFETGGNGWGNNEQQYYQPGNASIEGGNLIITAKKETVDTNNYTSSRLTTEGKKEFLYGRIDARIKLPPGQGFWPAFWMLGSNIRTVDWPACGEIDIIEYINDDSTIYGTLHWDSSGHILRGDSIISTPSQYHVYSIEWDAATIKWFVDSVQYHEVNITGAATSELHQPFFILLNFAVGGNWPGQSIDDSLLPAKMYIDYIRVYQKQ